MLRRLVLRDLLFRAEPFAFKALSPLLNGRVRYGRSLAAQKYLKGRGAEIGAFESPTLTPLGSKTLYIDRVPASHWKDHPEYRGLKLVEPDILDDGAILSSVVDNGLDYLIAAHVLEHIEDPIAALKNWLRVVRPGGHLLVIVPDKRFTFDKNRELTPLSHFFEEHERGPRKGEHHREYGGKVLGLNGAELDEYVAKADPAIHFHTWTLESFITFLLEANDYLGRPFEILEVGLNVCEDLAALRVR